jgi:membrane protein YdbS with pleckstrin-like domain
MADGGAACSNCERKIGRLERSYSWQGHDVCFECYERLQRAGPDEPEEPRTEATGKAAATEVDAEAASEVAHWSASPAIIGYLPLYTLACAVAVGWLVAAWIAPVPELALGAPVFLMIVVVKEFVRRSVRYSIVGKRLVLDRGILNRSHHEVWAPDIREVTNNQTLVGRLCGFGTVTVDTAAHEGAEIKLENIPRPGEVVKLLNSLR